MWTKSAKIMEKGEDGVLESENQPFAVPSFTKIKGKTAFPGKGSLLGF
jgi:hypothetical protein